MKNSFSIKLIREIGQGVKKVVYKKRLGKWTLGYGKWVPRLISPYITWTFLKIFPGITPNMVSYLMILTCIGALILLLKGFFFWGGIVLCFSIVLDKVDGEVARMKSLYSHRGVFLDYQYHFIYWLLFLFEGLGVYIREGTTYLLFLGSLNSLIGMYLEYTQISYVKVLFKTKDDTGQVPAVDFSNIKPLPLQKIIIFFGNLFRQDTVALFLVLFGIFGYWYPTAPTVFQQVYFLVLAINAVIFFTTSFRNK